jgi:glutaconate CoA-transferase subunit B
MAERFTWKELLTVHLARTFRNGEVGFTGLATGKAAMTYITSIPLAAMRLAQLTHAPDLTILLAGWCVNPDLSKLTRLPESEYGNELLDLPCEAQMTTWPGPWSHHRGEISFAFCSGVQMDMWGNVNCTCVGDPARPKVALVGPIFLPEHFSCFSREYIMMPHHQARSFVERVDHVSGVGFPGGREGRKALGMEGSGPCCAVTPLCIFEFDETGRARVASIHPGVDPAQVAENTGFDVGDLSQVPVTQAPTDEELDILRKQVDPRGILLGD